MVFADVDAAMDWIDANQLGRRNLTPDQRSIIRGRRYNRMKKAQGGAREASGQSDHLKTAAAICIVGKNALGGLHLKDNQLCLSQKQVDAIKQKPAGSKPEQAEFSCFVR